MNNARALQHLDMESVDPSGLEGELTRLDIEAEQSMADEGLATVVEELDLC